jgi:hypothetical protein
MIVEFHVRMNGARQGSDGAGSDGTGHDGYPDATPVPIGQDWVVTVEWTVPGSGRARDRWLVGVVLDPACGGPAVRHQQTVISDGVVSRHTVEAVVGVAGAGPAESTYRGIATLSRRSVLADDGSVAGFAELGAVRFHYPGPIGSDQAHARPSRRRHVRST